MTILAGCTESPAKITETADRGPALIRRPITSLRMDRGLTARSVIDCPTGECIVLHYPVKFVSQPGEIEQFFQDLRNLISASPEGGEDDGEVLHDDWDHWSHDQRLGGGQATFNCCTYAVADVAGLTKSDWISPNPIDATDFTIPMKVLLDSFYRSVHIESLNQIDWNTLERDPRIKDGDVFCYVRLGVQGESIGQIQEFTHVGKILRRDDRHWLVSKLGMGPVVRSGLGATGKLFHGEFDQIRVYRPLSSSL
ncbi:MAG TPA: hypothetical protein VLA12_20840 [Planctomycetaceae bacterium]|nr:hypothetical protein [Planctomycetaceae bacterium]